MDIVILVVALLCFPVLGLFLIISVCGDPYPRSGQMMAPGGVKMIPRPTEPPPTPPVSGSKFHQHCRNCVFEEDLTETKRIELLKRDG